MLSPVRCRHMEGIGEVVHAMHADNHMLWLVVSLRGPDRQTKFCAVMRNENITLRQKLWNGVGNIGE